MLEPQAPGRVLVVDPAVGEQALAELADLTGLGLVPTVNVRRVADTGIRARIETGWETVDFDGFSEEELARNLEDEGRGYHALKCRAGIPLTRMVLERATQDGLRRRLVLAGRAAAGSDTFDRAAAQRLGVAIRTTPGANAAARRGARLHIEPRGQSSLHLVPPRCRHDPVRDAGGLATSLGGVRTLRERDWAVGWWS